MDEVNVVATPEPEAPEPDSPEDSGVTLPEPIRVPLPQADDEPAR